MGAGSSLAIVSGNPREDTTNTSPRIGWDHAHLETNVLTKFDFPIRTVERKQPVFWGAHVPSQNLARLVKDGQKGWALMGDLNIILGRRTTTSLKHTLS